MTIPKKCDMCGKETDELEMVQDGTEIRMCCEECAQELADCIDNEDEGQ